MDDADSHKKFCESLTLPFDLIADPDKAVHTAYGYKGMVRTFVLIDKTGTILYVNKEYKLKKEQWEELLKEVQALKK